MVLKNYLQPFGLCYSLWAALQTNQVAPFRLRNIDEHGSLDTDAVDVGATLANDVLVEPEKFVQILVIKTRSKVIIYH